MTRLRSALFLPASNPRAITKARTLACDAVILDLEDAVAPEAKTEARGAAAAALAAGLGSSLSVLRINGRDTEWGEADLQAAVSSAPHVVLAPKVEDAPGVCAYHQALEAAPESLRLWAMIETPAALLNLREIAACSRETRLAGLVVGLNDLGLALNARRTPDRAGFAWALQSTVAAARAHGLAVLDAVFNALDDAEGLEAECRQGRDWGFDGKTLIHPRQIEAANRAFSPSEPELAWARSVVEAFDQPGAAGQGVLRVNGAMVERLHLQLARRLFAQADPGEPT